MIGIKMLVDVKTLFGVVLKNNTYRIGKFTFGVVNKLNKDGSFTTKHGSKSITFSPNQFKQIII
jgi:hypothetical protein